MKTILIILWVICSIASFVIYHKLFDVVYFDLANGCLKEVIICIIIGAILAGLITLYWYISIPVVILFVIALAKNNS